MRIHIRKPHGGEKSVEEKWLTSTQKCLNPLLQRFHCQEKNSISTALPLFIAYHPDLNTSVSHEGACPGFSAWFLARYTTCKFNAGVFSPPLDSSHESASAPSQASAYARRTRIQLLNSIRSLESNGSFIVAMYHNEKNDLCFYKTEAFPLLDASEIPGAFMNM